MTRKINKYMFLCGCAGIMLIGFASGAAACPTNTTWIKIGDYKNYDNCTIHGTEIDIGSNNSFKNASINATIISVNGENNDFTNAKLTGTDLRDSIKANNPGKYCKSGWIKSKDNKFCKTCPSTATQIWTGATFSGTWTNYVPAKNLTIIHVTSKETGCWIFKKKDQ